MDACSRMKELVTRIVAKHGIDLNDPDLELWLEIEGVNRLVIQGWGWTLLSVETCYARDSDLSAKAQAGWVGNPRVILFSGAGAWEPVELIGPNGKALVSASLSEDLCQIVAVNTETQAVMERLVERLVNRLENQGWLEEGQRIEPDHTLVPRTPTVLNPPELGVFVLQQLR